MTAARRACAGAALMLGAAGPPPAPAPETHENITVHGRHLEPAPTPDYRGNEMPPWERWRIHHDNRTGTNTAAFGGAYSAASPLCDCGSADPAGQFFAPRRPK